MKTSEFDYTLPEARIAQTPVEPRDSSKLLVLDRKTGNIQHQAFRDILSLLRPGDLLVRNVSKVFHARLRGMVGRREHEVFLLRPDHTYWEALIKKSKHLRLGEKIHFEGATAILIQKNEDGVAIIDFRIPPEEVFELAERIGQVPTPPYVKTLLLDDDQYQTVYAKETGSVAAPTAGFHFTQNIIDQLTEKGIEFADVVLHVGLGTFRPVMTETIEEHAMHHEWVHIPVETTEAIARTKKNGGRVIAIGTTSVRALESGVTDGMTNIFITPGYHFKQVDAMITNFHLPKSTLLMLVSSFVQDVQTENDHGRKIVLNAYQEAIQHEYRFYSFGDAMFIE